MALQPSNLTEERLMGLCTALYHLLQVQKYILESMPLSDDRPHKEHVRRQEMFRLIDKANDQLHIYFLGD